MEATKERQIITRIAPTPSGYPHLGNAFNFLLTWLTARSNNGKVILRIDDLDQKRMRHEYVEDIFRTLDWLGIDWDEGPQSPDELTNTWSQTHRLDLYHQLIDQLIASGKVYACTCSRNSLSEKGYHNHYPNICYPKQLPLNGNNRALRLYVPEGISIPIPGTVNPQTPVILGNGNIDLYNSMGGFIIRRKDKLPAYQIASLADDIHFGVNTIVRGKGLISSTAAQLYIAEVACNKSFKQTQFIHHTLLIKTTGEKLSKSTGNAAPLSLLEHYITPTKLYHHFAKWLWATDNYQHIISIEDLLAHFTTTKN